MKPCCLSNSSKCYPCCMPLLVVLSIIGLVIVPQLSWPSSRYVIYKRGSSCISICISSCQGGSGLVGDDDGFGSGGAISARVESSYIVNLGGMDMKHVKDYTFVNGEFGCGIIFGRRNIWKTFNRQRLYLDL